jgi:hypothetical protein
VGLKCDLIASVARNKQEKRLTHLNVDWFTYLDFIFLHAPKLYRTILLEMRNSQMYGFRTNSNQSPSSVEKASKSNII